MIAEHLEPKAAAGCQGPRDEAEWTSMNESERRRPRVVELKKIRKEDIAGGICIWRDCGADYSGDPPEGWVFLRVGRPDPVQKAVHTLVDAALCPEHAAELERNLKQPVDPALLSDPEGRA
jgi:hypothetical protein